MTRVLVTVSGSIPADLDEQIANGERPRTDYVEIAKACGADLLDVPAARAGCGRLGRTVERLGGPSLLLAWACFRRRRAYDAILTDGEQVGLPFAALLRIRRGRRPAHVMIVHIMSVRKKIVVYRALRLAPAIDRMVVYASRQRDFLIETLGYPADQVVLSSFMVDTSYWSTGGSEPDDPPLVSAAGRESRDYPTLIEAVRGLDVRCVITTASAWSKRGDSTENVELPANVEVCGLSYPELRNLYDRSAAIVVPLLDVEFQAGVTAVLEGMSMSRAVVCTRTRGQVDVVADGVDGVYVPPGDVAALRDTLLALIADPDRRRELGANARAKVVDRADIVAYARRLAQVVGDAAR